MPETHNYEHAAPAASAKPKRRRIVTLSVASAALLAGVAAAPLIGAPTAATGQESITEQVSPSALAHAGFADMVEKVAPAVVNISTTSTRSQRAMPNMPNFRAPQFPPGSPFEEFFRRFFEDMPGGGQEQQMRPREVQALGSGFIIDPTGYVVTNNHVIDNASEITVILDDERRYEAELIGRDPQTDLALLKIEADEPLPYVEFGSSESARIGDWVMAIGNPFGLGGTVTAGIISARGRNINAGPFDDFLQIDASINRGNSGGPLFDQAGNVIGVNTAIYSPSGGNVGIGFAVPSSLAEPVIAQLKETGHVERGWLGVQIQAVTPEIAQSLGLSEDKGALVGSVVPDSPAAEAGLQQGDVIAAFDGQTVDKVRDLPRLVAAAKVKDRVPVEVWRQGSRQTIDVVIGRLEPETVAAAERDEGAVEPSANAQLGLALAPLTSEMRRQYQLDETVQGAVVVNVVPNSTAAQQGIRQGDVIVMVGQERVSSPEDVAKGVEAATAAQHDAVLLLVNSQGTERFVAVRIAEA